MSQDTKTTTCSREPMVEFRKTRVFRETLAHIGNHGDPFSRRRAIVALSVWKKLIEDQCPHLERVQVVSPVTGRKVMKCLDCGNEA